MQIRADYTGSPPPGAAAAGWQGEAARRPGQTRSVAVRSPRSTTSRAKTALALASLGRVLFRLDAPQGVEEGHVGLNVDLVAPHARFRPSMSSARSLSHGLTSVVWSMVVVRSTPPLLLRVTFSRSTLTDPSRRLASSDSSLTSSRLPSGPKKSPMSPKAMRASSSTTRSTVTWVRSARSFCFSSTAVAT